MAERRGVWLVGAVRGLVSEGERVARLLIDLRPEKVGLSISPESLDALASHIDAGLEGVGPNTVEEEVYMVELERFGEVVKPPPCFTDAWKYCKEGKIPVVALDMDEVHFTDAYCSHISGLEMVMQGRRSRKLERRRFTSNTAEDFVVEWDSAVNSSKGFLALEREREGVIARNISKAMKGAQSLCAIVELERVGGVGESLTAMGCEFERV